MIKDPVHGYITIRRDYMNNIIDSCEFQRLRNIRQTSYDSLYPGSSHNRFIHSLGVYYLGNKAFEAFRINCQEEFEDKGSESICGNIDWTCLKNTFELSCLLHDVGHTPFSHTGENFLLRDKEQDRYEIVKQRPRGKKESPEVPALYNGLLKIMEEKLVEERFEVFYDDFSETIHNSHNYISSKTVAKPHEIMSVIIAIETYSGYFEMENVDLELFARGILGIKYKDEGINNLEIAIKNGLIQMLNSSIIDVDRLDYIMRDMQMSGFDSVSIDIERLLESVIIIYDSDRSRYLFAYKKNALSTIENVVLAHDAERRWIQGHPVIMHDSFLVEKSLETVNKSYKVEYEDKSIFQKKALSLEGVCITGELTIKLMNDGDFSFLMKQIPKDNLLEPYITEYLSRDKRKQPIWKSESEFRIILSNLSDIGKNTFNRIFGSDGEKTKVPSIGSVLDQNRINELENEIEKLDKDISISEEDKEHRTLFIRKMLFWLICLKEFCNKHDIEFKIYNQKAKPFQSKINELSNADVMIWYKEFGKVEKIADVIKVYRTNEERDNQTLFYWYIDKSEQYTLDKFIDFLKKTYSTFEQEFG